MCSYIRIKSMDLFRQHIGKIAKQWLLFTIPYSISMSAAQGWKSGVVAGLIFGTAMTAVFWRPQSEISHNSENLKIKLPPLINYIVITGLFFFSGLAIVASFGSHPIPIGILGLLVALCFIMLFSLKYCFSAQVIGRSYIVDKRLFHPVRVFYLRNLKEARVSAFQTIILRFNDSRCIDLSAHSNDFLFLPPQAENTKNLQTDGLFRLVQEIRKRQALAGTQEDNNERNELLSQVQTLPLTLKSFMACSIVILSVSFTALLGVQTHQQKRLETTADISNLKKSDFENAFFLFHGGKFEELSQKYTSLCSTNHDHNCRFAAYLKEMAGDMITAHSLMKLGCSPTDPHSCYNIYNSKLASVPERKSAADILENACQTPTHSFKVCCTCYLSSKRQPANN